MQASCDSILSPDLPHAVPNRTPALLPQPRQPRQPRQPQQPHQQKTETETETDHGTRGFFDVTDSDAGKPSYPTPQSAETMTVMGCITLANLPEHVESEYPVREFCLLGSEEHMLYAARKSTRDALLERNRAKNRYMNVSPYDDTRVRLSRAGGDYINASWVCGLADDESVDEHAYVATQGPLASTVDDFWRMVWETGADTIVMLSREVEKGLPKVDRYWPTPDRAHALQTLPWETGVPSCTCGGSDSSSALFTPPFAALQSSDQSTCRCSRNGSSSSSSSSNVLSGRSMVVRALGEETLGDWDVVKRSFELARRDEPGVCRAVVQYQYGGWPDHGVPQSTEPIRRLLGELRARPRRPIVVHCSAGIGRTGAFCTIQTHVERMQQLKAAGVPRAWLAAFAVDVYWTVVQLRWCRFGMVQQIDQYAFCYTAILDEARALGLIRLSFPPFFSLSLPISLFHACLCVCALSPAGPCDSDCPGKVEELTTLCTKQQTASSQKQQQQQRP